MSKINGKNVTLSVLVEASPSYSTVIGCSRTCSLTTDVETAGISTVGSGTFREYKALNKGWSVTVDGLCTVDQNMGLLQLRQLQFALQPILIDFSETQGSTTIHYSGRALITSVQSTGVYNDIENYSVSLLGTGELFMYAGALIYGAPPPSFNIALVQPNVPTSGQTSLTFSWSTATPAPDSYTIQINDLTTGITTYDTGLPPFMNAIIVVDSSHNYSFAVAGVYFSGAARTEYSSLINWP